MSELDWLRTREEGQFLERKGCYDRSDGKVRRRNARDVADDVAETLMAMANADGGTLVVGIEDDGTVTGVDYPDDRVAVILEAPQTRVLPPLTVRVQDRQLEKKRILIFDVDWSADVHQLTDGRYKLRVGDRNMPFPAQDIAALKESRQRRATEIQIVPGATLNDIDLELVRRLAVDDGERRSTTRVLERYRLVESRERRVAVSLAALLLFGKDPGRWHPRCGIDFVRYAGTERQVGTAFNVTRRDRIEGPLVELPRLAFTTIRSQVRERQPLVDLFFEEQLEYPTFAWQEALVNAIAHRDYRYDGLGVEVWMFDDRLEVRSPGELVEPVTLERLRRRDPIHASRNPRIVRVLTDAGYMREQGEGVPRMFEVMERAALHPPELRLEADVIFTVTLRNAFVYPPETMRWLAQFDLLGLSANQKRALAYAREHGGSFTSRAYQDLAHLDLYTASRDIKELVRKGLVLLPQKGGRVYQLATARPTIEPDVPAEYRSLEPLLRQQGFVTNSDIRTILGVPSRQASRIAAELVVLGWLAQVGERRGRRYVPVK